MLNTKIALLPLLSVMVFALGCDFVNSPEARDALETGREVIETVKESQQVEPQDDFRPQAKDATMVLVERLTEKNMQLRWYAVRALGQIGRAAKRAVPALERSMKDSHYVVRAAAAIALGQIEAVEAEGTLKQALNDDNETVREAAKDALSRIHN